MTQQTGGPAFPFWSDSDGLAQYAGMTLRDYFAAKAMQGLIENTNWRGMSREILVKEAYAIADAMLKAREQ